MESAVVKADGDKDRPVLVAQHVPAAMESAFVKADGYADLSALTNSQAPQRSPPS